MLTPSASRQRGLNLIEVMVVLAILALLLLAGTPSLAEWIRNNRIRLTGESLLSGLQTAKNEAVSRNARVRFQLTSTLTAACVLDTAGLNWVINLDPLGEVDRVEGACDTAPNPDNPAAAPGILQTRSASEGTQGIEVVADEASVVFNGMGRLVPTPAATLVIEINNPTGGACAADGGPMNCLRIQISPAGQVRMCNPIYPAGDPQGC